MSAVDVIKKTIQDGRFRELFFSNRDAALGQFRLSREETEGLKKLDRRSYDKAITQMGADLEKRIASGQIKGGRIAYVDYPVIENYDAG